MSFLLFTEVRVLDRPITKLLEDEWLKCGDYASNDPSSEDRSGYSLDTACRTMSSECDIFLELAAKADAEQ